jgi:hypothetical protein
MIALVRAGIAAWVAEGKEIDESRNLELLRLSGCGKKICFESCVPRL